MTPKTIKKNTFPVLVAAVGLSAIVLTYNFWAPYILTSYVIKNSDSIDMVLTAVIAHERPGPLLAERLASPLANDVRQFRNALHSEERMKVILSIKALGVLKDKHSVESLCEFLLHNSDYQIRYTSATALGDIGDRSALFALYKAIAEDSHRVVVRKAMEAKTKID